MSYKIVYHEAHLEEREIGEHLHIYFTGSSDEIRQSKQVLEAKLGRSLEDISFWIADHGRNYEIPYENIDRNAIDDLIKNCKEINRGNENLL